MTVRVLVAEDNELIRAGLLTVLRSDARIEVVGEATNGVAAVRLAKQLRPDLVLMDVEMPGGDGISATAALCELGDPRVLILTMFDLDEYVVAGLRAVASGFLIKTTPPGELLDAIRACAAGETTVGPSVMARLVATYIAQPVPGPVPGLDQLTDRETEVLKTMAKGLSNAEIGAALWMAETTVKTHAAHIFAKLGVRDRVQAVVLAHRCGLATDR